MKKSTYNKHTVIQLKSTYFSHQVENNTHSLVISFGEFIPFTFTGETLEEVVIKAYKRFLSL